MNIIVYQTTGRKLQSEYYEASRNSLGALVAGD
jgi:hypothetical protein